MRIGETVSITLAGQEIILRPTLREALRLERRKGGMYRLGEGLCEHSLEAACLLIASHTNMQFLPNRVYDAGVDKLAPHLTYYLLGLMGADPDAPRYDGASRDNEPPRDEQSRSYLPILTRLFALGTGWLGWSPEATFDASPREILAAYQGRLDMLRSIFGGEQASTEPAKPQDLDSKVKAIFGKLQTVKAA